MSAMWIIRLTIIILCTTLTVLSVIFLSFIPILMWCCVSLFAALGIFAGIIYTPLFFRTIRAEISQASIRVTSGLFFSNSESMKLSAIQYVTFISTPFSKKSGINFIILNALGGKLFLPFLKHSDAEELYNELNAAIDADTAAE